MFKLILTDTNTLFLTSEQEIVSVCKVLATKNRVKIVVKADGDMNFTKMKEATKLSEQNLSKHLRKIIEVNLVSKISKSNTKFYVRNYDYILIKL